MPDALQTELTRKPTPEPVEDTARWPEWAEEARLDDELTARSKDDARRDNTIEELQQAINRLQRK